MILTWLLVGVWIASACGQIRALPPNVAESAPPAFHAYPPGTFYGPAGPTSPQLPATPAPRQDLNPVGLSGASYNLAFHGAVSDPVPAPGGPDPVGPSLLGVMEEDDYTPTAYQAGAYGNGWTWQSLPDGLMYKSYLAGGRESRIASIWLYERDQGWLWDVTLGGRVGILRYGTQDDAWPEGWQLDVEGAAFPRLSLERARDLVSTDFRFGVPLTFREGRWEWKVAYYHLSSHLADEYLETFPTATRVNYVRDVLVMGAAMRPHPELRLYAEVGYAFYTDGGSKPWEFQFGLDYSPVEPTGFSPAPFFAVNGQIREDVDFGGNFTMQTGWQWRGRTGHLFRLGFHYFNGMSDQYQFFTEHEEHIGVGLWYDF